MKDKVLFAKTGIARFMALLVTLLTMFASCNFVGGQDARKIVAIERMFSSPIEGVDLCLWGDGSVGFTLKINTITTNGDGWAGGHFGSMDPNTKGTEGVDPYDVSKIAYAKCKIECDADISGEAFSIALFGGKVKDENGIEKVIGESVAIDSATANVAKEIKLDVLSNPGTSFVLFSISFTPHQVGKKFKISNFTFYDKDGNEVVPKLVKSN